VYAATDDYRFHYEEEIARRAADFRPVLDMYLEDAAEEFRGRAARLGMGAVRDGE
jgi:hypothetical protein